jgi:hypothetical protein
MVGRQISYVGMTLTALGGSITAPLIIAFKQAENQSHKVWQVMEKVRNATTNLGVSIAESLVPTIDKIVNLFTNLVDRWMALDPAVRQNILNTVFMSGAFLTLGGIITMIVGKFIAMTGVIIQLGSRLLLSISKINLIGIAITGVIYAMFKWQWVGTLVMNTFEVIWGFFLTGINTVKIAFLELIQLISRGLAWVAEKFSKIPLPKVWKEGLKSFASVSKKFAEDIEKDQIKAFKSLEKSATDANIAISNLMTGKEGNFAKGFEQAKVSLGKFQAGLRDTFKLFQGLSGKGGKSGEDAPVKSFFDGLNPESLFSSSLSLKFSGNIHSAIAEYLDANKF